MSKRLQLMGQGNYRSFNPRSIHAQTPSKTAAHRGL